MQTYRAKIDLKILVPIAAIMLGIIAFLVFKAFNASSSAEMATVSGFALFLLAVTTLCMLNFFATRYTLDGTELRIYAGILYNKSISVASIRKIKETRDLISSPAPSLDRLEIFFNKFDSVLISPKDKAGFIAHLIRLNPGIEIG